MPSSESNRESTSPSSTELSPGPEKLATSIGRRMIRVGVGAGILLICTVIPLIVFARPVAAAELIGEQIQNAKFALTIPQGWYQESRGQAFIELHKNGKHELLRIGVGKAKWKEWHLSLAAKVCSIIEDARRPASWSHVQIDQTKTALNGPRGVTLRIEYIYAPQNDVAYTGRGYYWTTVAKDESSDYQIMVTDSVDRFDSTFQSAWPLASTVQWKNWTESQQNPTVPNSEKLQHCGIPSYGSIATPNSRIRSIVG